MGSQGLPPPTGSRGGSPTFSPGTDAGRVCPKALHDAEPTKHTQPFPWKGVFGKDAEIRTRRALHEAKPSECPKGDRGSELEVCFKNILFLQTKTTVAGMQRWFCISWLFQEALDYFLFGFFSCKTQRAEL